MDHIKDNPAPEPRQPQDNNGQEQPKDTKPAPKRHLIRPRWLRITLKSLMWLLIAVIALPFMLYIPPVQTFVKNVACKVVYNSTGMKIGLDRLRIRFPLDIEMQNLSVVQAGGDTMVAARSAVADLRLEPLLRLDLDVKQLKLEDGYFGMLSPDSSMRLSVRAALLTLRPGSSIDIANSHIDLEGATVRNGRMSLVMDVWKQKPTPKDTTSLPFVIRAKEIELDNFTFGMSMLPTIDTLTLADATLRLSDGLVDLRENKISARLLTMSGADVTYLTPTPEYIETHPAPAADTISEPSAPIVITADSIALDGCKVLYAMKGATPLPGFDASYIQLDRVGVGMRGFYNCTSTVRLPLTRLQARERSGLEITRGRGTVLVDSTGLTLDSLRVHTPYSSIAATAGLPFALMAMQPGAPLNVRAQASIGMPDVDAFMPALRQYTAKIPSRSPLALTLDADGTLGDARINTLDASLPGVLTLAASGTARNALDTDRMVGALDFDARLQNPGVVESLIGKLGFEIPALTLKGRATADCNTYGADFDLLLPEGTVAGSGKVGLTSETYAADIAVNRIDVGRFMPGSGLGALTARLKARGNSFDPERHGAKTDINLDLSSLRYRDMTLTDITAAVTLADGVFTVDASSRNPGAMLDLAGHGTVAPDLYGFDINADISDLDLQRLGMSQTPLEIVGQLGLRGTASPARWLYDADLDIDRLDLRLPGEQSINVPELMAHFESTDSTVNLRADATGAHMAFDSRSGLKTLLDQVTEVSDLAARQVAARDLRVDSLRRLLPVMNLRAEAAGQGTLGALLEPSGLYADSLSLRLSTDSLLQARFETLGLQTKGLVLDTLTFGVSERGDMLDYLLHLGNRPGNLDEFADVNIRGYAGGNRLSVFAVQHNTKGEMGYRLGLTAAAMADTTVSVHFTPLKATIGYMPWTFNADNHLDYDFKTMRLDADLSASSLASSISIKTLPAVQGGDELALSLQNINIEDFLKLSVFAPPLTATINSQVNLYYNGHGFEGHGDLGITNFTYARKPVGDLDLGLNASYDNDGSTLALLSLRVDQRDALKAHAVIRPDSAGTMQTDSVWLALDRFPLKTVNPFLGPDEASLSGELNGRLDLEGTVSRPVLNGQIACDSVGVYLPIAATTLHLDNEPLTVTDNVIRFNQYDIWAVNKNPLTIDGTIDASKLRDIRMDLRADASNMQLVGNDRRAGSQLYGKLFINLAARVRGSMKLLDVNANADILGNTDITYVLDMNPAVAAGGMDNVVKFVNFADTAQVAAADSLTTTMAMRIDAALRLTPGMQAKVYLGTDGDVELQPSGTLNYFQNYMGDMKLNGTLNTGEGSVAYAVQPVGKFEFNISPTSQVIWNGDIMNPVLNLHAYDDKKVNIKDQGGSNTRLVNFRIGLSATNTLSAPNVAFDLSTDNDMTIENELASMSADQKATQAMNILLYGQYTGPGVSTQGGNIANTVLNSFLSSTINNWAANAIHGVDLSFGVDQYSTRRDGTSGTSTSYSYQVSKSLFDNRFKINVGGNYTTDASADENLSENLVSDISFEYMLRQTNNVSMYVSLFRHNGYESILEGEVTEMGAAFVLRRRINSLRQLFNFLHRSRRHSVGGKVDTPAPAETQDSTENPSTPAKRPEDEEK